MKKFLFRADDLGYSRGVNYGIKDVVEAGIINNVGVMINMESAVHGIQLLKEFPVCLGLHTNISSGNPVTNPKKIPSIVTKYGTFKNSKEYNTAEVEFVDLDEVILEIEAQYHKFVEVIGRKPDYLDAHAVLSMNFYKGLEIVAEKYDIKLSPLPVDIEKPISIGNTSVYLAIPSNKEYHSFEQLKEMISVTNPNTHTMIIYHPGYLDTYILENSSLQEQRVYETNVLCNPSVKEYLDNLDIECITYHDL